MKYFLISILLLLFTVKYSLAQCPPNIDFEQGSFANWECFIGTVDTLNLGNVITMNPSPPTVGRHEIMDSATAGLDPYGNFPRACPYGNRYSVKLGNSGTNSQAEGVSYTFLIPPLADTFSLTYYYAVVFEDPGHLAIEQPRFYVTAYDVVTGTVIDCAAFSYVSNGTIPGFQVSPSASDVLYKEWTPASIDFSGLGGRTVRLEFKTADCTRGGHFGYAYVDVGAGCGGVLAVGAYCVSTNSATLNAPYGFQNYTWYNNNYSVVLGTSRTVTLSPPPPVNSLFHVDMVPYPGYGCRDTADARLEVLPVPDTPVAVSPVYYCQNFPAPSLQAIANNGQELLWYTAATGGTPSSTAPIPSTITLGSVDYWVSQKSLFGCEGPRKKITVTVSPTPIPSFTINNIRQCENNNSFIFTNTATNTTPGSLCHWSFGDGQTADQCVATHIYTAAGQYTVTLSINNLPSCSIQISQTVNVVPKPIAAFGFPSVICENQTSIVLQNNSYVPGGLSSVNGYWWQVASNVSTIQSPVPFMSNGGPLPVKLAVTTTEGCKSDTVTQVINVHYSPIPTFSVGPLLCENEIIRLRDLSTMPGTAGSDYISKWNWWYDNIPSSILQHPSTLLTTGTHHIKLSAESNFGCNWRSIDNIFVIHPKPLINLNISDSCVFRNIIYTAGNTGIDPISKWLWNFGNGFVQQNAIISKNFSKEGSNPVNLIGQTTNNCKDTLVRPFSIYYNRSKALRDTTVAKNEPLRLSTSAALNILWYKWSPDIGLNSTTIGNPVATYDDDQVYELSTLTIQGCESYSKVRVKRFDGPQLYVPGAFTPNADGLNDKLKVFPVGIMSFNYFSVYNRNGQLVFRTTDYNEGWDGTFKGAPVDPSNYVWVALAIDYKGKKLLRKGNVLLFR